MKNRAAKGCASTALGLLTMLVSGAAASPCQLSAADFASMSKSYFAISTQAQVDALPAERQGYLCRTRAIWDRIEAGGSFTADEVLHLTARFLSPEELKIHNPLLDLAFSDTMEHKPDAEIERDLEQLRDKLLAEGGR